MNLETLEDRLLAMIKRLPFTNQNQRYQQQNNANVAMGTMIPTPGVPQNGNSNLMAPQSTDNSLVGGNNSMMSSAGNPGSFSMNASGPSRGMHTSSFEGIHITYSEVARWAGWVTGQNTSFLSIGRNNTG